MLFTLDKAANFTTQRPQVRHMLARGQGALQTRDSFGSVSYCIPPATIGNKDHG